MILNNSTSSIQSFTVCDSLTWIDSITYTTDTIVDYQLTNSVGCDSIITLNLTVISSTYNTDSVIACDSHTWINGETYTTSNNTATDTLINSAGCDSIVYLNLTINYTDSITEAITACDSITWTNGLTYSTSNNSATQILSNTNGCDSVVSLDLTILQSTYANDVFTSCDSFTWIDGNTYFANNNSATFTLANQVGCDSIVNLDLTIHSSDSTVESITACDSYTWLDGNTYTTSTNSPVQTFLNMNGCDSTVILDLTILNSSSSTDTHMVCDSLTWIDGNTYYTSNTSAQFVLPSQFGCDSIVSLDLTILSNNSIDTIHSCGPYTWLDGNTYTSSTNAPTISFTNAAGCDSLVTLNLNVHTIDTSIFIMDSTLTSNESNANSLQWYTCDSAVYTAIPGATDQSYIATQDGEYMVEIVKNECKDSSDCQLITAIGINETSVFESVFIYPNPSDDFVNVSIGDLKNVNIRILSPTGQLISKITNVTDFERIELGKTSGVYVIELECEVLRKRFRVIKN